MKTSLFIQIFIASTSIATSLRSGEVIHTEGAHMTSTITYDVCNPEMLYGNPGEYSYSLPKSVLESYLSGKAFDHPQVYTEEESRKLHEDINAIFKNILSNKPIKANLAVMTAGAPGAGKTVKMRQDLNKQASLGTVFAYICPDDVCLNKQTLTYQSDVKNGDESQQARQAAYNKWRPGSNAATHLILGNLIRERYAFYFGTTSSGPSTGKFYEFLKKQGYQIKVLHMTAPDDVRWGSIQERDKTFVQTTQEDIKEKGLLLPQRIADTFLAYADEIEFYYRDAIKKEAKLAAKWIRNQEASQGGLGTLQVLSSDDYEHIKAIHNAATTLLERPDLLWEATVEKSSTIIGKISQDSE